MIGGEPLVEDVCNQNPAVAEDENPRRLLTAVSRVALDADRERFAQGRSQPQVARPLFADDLDHDLAASCAGIELDENDLLPGAE
jgi:hypothetical protein